MIITADFATSQINALLGHLTARIRHTRRSPDPEAVHDLRVSIRRFDQALLLFASLIGEKDVKKARRRLKKLMALAGAVRNCDIAGELVVPRLGSARKIIRRARERAEARLGRALRRWIHKGLSSEVADLVQLASGESTVRLRLKRLGRQLTESGESAVRSCSPAALHRFRIAAKHYRYTLEIIAPLIGRRRAARHLTVIRKIQARLGDVNDCATVRTLAARWRLGRNVDRFLRKRERRQMERFRQEWKAQIGRPERAASRAEGRHDSIRQPV